MKQLEQRIEVLLKQCRRHNITPVSDLAELELEALDGGNKIQAGMEVNYGGFDVNGEGVKPNPKKVKAICDFP